MSTGERSHDAQEAVDVEAKPAGAVGAAATVKLDAAALRRLVVATVLTVDDSGPLVSAASRAGPPERL